jgi:type VI protein secretion system component Hcp
MDSTSSSLFRETLSPSTEGLTAQIDFVPVGADPSDSILTLTFDNVLITTFNMSGGRGSDKTSLEQITMNFTKVDSVKHPGNTPP